MLIRTTAEAGWALRQLRERGGLSRMQLAERAKVSERWLVNFENGKQSVDLALVLQSLAELGCCLGVVGGLPVDGQAPVGEARVVPGVRMSTGQSQADRSSVRPPRRVTEVTDGADGVR